MMAEMVQMEQAAQVDKAAKALEMRKMELHAYVRGWMSKSMMARRANYEDKWNRWRRNARNMYDPVRLQRKEKWQSALFIPITMQNKEIIKAQFFRTLVSGLPYGVRTRPSGSQDEAINIKELFMRSMERSKLGVSLNDCFDDMLTYGTHFLKIYRATEFKWRSKRVPIIEPITPDVINRALQTGQPPQIIGYDRTPPQPTLTFKGTKADHVSIWDMFLEDRCANLQSSPHAQRYKMTFQEILDGVAQGYYFPEAALKLANVRENGQVPLDQQAAERDLGHSQIHVARADRWKEHTIYEWWGMLPRRLVYLWPDQQHLLGDDPEGLVPARVLFTNEALCATAENEDYCGESPFLSSGYLKVPGSVYHIGVAEMLEQIQDSINEDTNQRKDNVQLILNRMFAILERAIVSRSDLVSRPGGAIRIKSNASDDVNKAIKWLETPDVTQSSYQETFNTERFAQELTGANRVTIGSGGTSAKDVTQTRGGMEILRQSANDRFTYYAMVQEADFIVDLIRRFYRLEYQHIDQEEIVRVLGPARAQGFILRPPEEIEQDYSFTPEGVFAAINQPVRIAQWQAFRDQYAGAPFFDDMQMAITMARAIELPDQDRIVLPMRDPQTGQIIPFQMLQQLSLLAQAKSGLPGPIGGPGQARADTTKPRMQSKKPGANEAQG